MSDIVAFIEARLAEDEATARAVPPTFDLFDGTGVIVMRAATGTRSVTLPSHVASFTARHDPARVLREVEAKRRIVRQCVVMEPDMTFVTDNRWGFRPGDHTELAAQTLALLALPYADHPDYDPSWSPS